MRDARIVGLLAFMLALVLSVPTQAAERLNSDQRKRLALIKKELAVAEAPVLALFDEAIAMGPAAERQLVTMLRKVLDTDEKAVVAACRQLRDSERIAQLREQHLAERQAAWTVITALSKANLREAKQHYSQLDEQYTLLRAVYAEQSRILVPMARRQALLERYRRLQPDDQRRYSAEDETRLRQAAEQALGATVTEIQQAMRAQQAPAKAVLAEAWAYARARRIEAYNATLKELCSDREYANLVATNHYREILGVRPFELDPRLIQSARRHTKQMVDMNFFGHGGKTPETKSHTGRMKLAGYKGGYSENCAFGYPSGQAAFWGWFSSPGHHKNMVAKGSIAIGIGAIGVKWTQNFGRGKSLFAMSPTQRQQHPVQGSIVPPQP